jgi:hypothetical protein
MDSLNVCVLGPTRYRDGLALMDALVARRAERATGCSTRTRAGAHRGPQSE